MHECSISFWCCSGKYTDDVTRAEIDVESVRYSYRYRDRTLGGGTSAVSRHLGLHGAIYRYATLAVSAAREHVRYARAEVVRDSVCPELYL